MGDGKKWAVVTRQNRDKVKTLVAQLKEEAGSPRAVMILGCAGIDDLLANVIRAFLVPVSDSQDRDELLGLSRPLGTFGSRIEAAFRMGLISEDIKSSFNMLRRLRNNAAHVLTPFNLDESPHRERIDELRKRHAGDLQDLLTSEDDFLHALFAASLVALMVKIGRAPGQRLRPDDPITLSPDYIAGTSPR